MGARRKQRKQKSRMKYRHWYMPLVLIVLVVAGWQLSERMPAEIMPIDNVKIEGTFVHLSREDIQLRLKQELAGDYFTADIEALRTSLTSLPWVQDASIRRQWPQHCKYELLNGRPWLTGRTIRY